MLLALAASLVIFIVTFDEDAPPQRTSSPPQHDIERAWVAIQDCTEDRLGPDAYANFGSAIQQPATETTHALEEGLYQAWAWVEYVDEGVLRRRQFHCQVRYVGQEAGTWQCLVCPAWLPPTDTE